MAEGMYLRKISIKNFRSCYDTEIEFQPTITLLVGENNAGKSNIIEAIRLATAPANGRQSRYFEDHDRSAGREEDGIVISGEYDGLTDIQSGQYLTALDLGTNRVRYTVKFNLDKTKRWRSRPTYHAGKGDALDVEPDKREQIRHVYLAPLRDAQRALDSANGNRLMRVVEALFEESEKRDFVKAANERLSKLSDEVVLTKTATEIQGHLTHLTDPVRKQRVGINFNEQRLDRLVRSLRLKMAEHDVDLANLSESGLGYANLLYIATVILELDKAADAELTLFLVEEPEAHLHPQLQVALLDYLMSVADDSVGEDLLGPTGRIQIVATTHSPNLASGIKVENIVVLRSCGIELPVDEKAADSASSDEDKKVIKRQQTVGIPISRLELEPKALRKIRQYLDVTKSALLFGRRVVLVEGIAEAVLLPVLARHIVLKGTDDDMARERRRRFHATSIISVGGVDFEPYVQLLLGQVKGHSIVDHLVIVTDGDPKLPGMGGKSEAAEGNGSEGSPEAQDNEPGDDEALSTVFVNRKATIENCARRIGADDKLSVYPSQFTFEADLLREKVNWDVLKKCYLNQHPRNSTRWDEIVGSDDPAEQFYRKLRKNSKLIGKGQFAHDVAIEIEDGATFVCPDYLEHAITAVIDGKTDG